MAKALEKYWPELVSAFKKQQGGKEDDKVASSGVFTNDEMEDLNDEVSGHLALDALVHLTKFFAFVAADGPKHLHQHSPPLVR